MSPLIERVACSTKCRARQAQYTRPQHSQKMLCYQVMAPGLLPMLYCFRAIGCLQLKSHFSGKPGYNRISCDLCGYYSCEFTMCTLSALLTWQPVWSDYMDLNSLGNGWCRSRCWLQFAQVIWQNLKKTPVRVLSFPHASNELVCTAHYLITLGSVLLITSLNSKVELVAVRHREGWGFIQEFSDFCVLLNNCNALIQMSHTNAHTGEHTHCFSSGFHVNSVVQLFQTSLQLGDVLSANG